MEETSKEKQELISVLVSHIKTFDSEEQCEKFISDCEKESEDGNGEKIINEEKKINLEEEYYHKRLAEIVWASFRLWQEIINSTDIYTLRTDLKEEKIYPLVLPTGLILKRTINNKDCLYKAIYDYTFCTPTVLRKLVAKCIFENKDYFKKYTILVENQIIDDNYIDNIKKDGWPGRVEIIALMKVLGRAIVVVNSDGKIDSSNLIDIKELFGDNVVNPIFVHNKKYGDNYYDVLIIEEGKKDFRIKQIYKRLIEISESKDSSKCQLFFDALLNDIVIDFKKEIDNYINRAEDSSKNLFRLI